jgi:hypothetical protein
MKFVTDLQAFTVLEYRYRTGTGISGWTISGFFSNYQARTKLMQLKKNKKKLGHPVRKNNGIK